MNWKFIVPVVAAGLAAAALVPSAAAAVLPLLVLAVCPLAMVVGLAVISRRGEAAGEVAELRAEVARLRDDRSADVETNR